jgi:rod shape-determining protein MreC
MQSGRRWRLPSLRLLRAVGPWLLLLAALLGVRLSKGALLADAYALLSRPFWPGTAQREWLQSAQRLDQQARLASLERDNQRLRQLLALERQSGTDVTAAVISRELGGWWQQLLLGRGALAGLAPGDPVLAPGGLIGLVEAVTPTTARVTLLTDSSSRLGVWVGRSQRHGLLVGTGTSRPLLRFIEKDPGVRPGDVVTTSPASTLVPPNLTVGVIQSVDEQAVPAPEAVVQLSAPLEAIDWVQVRLRQGAKR